VGWVERSETRPLPPQRDMMGFGSLYASCKAMQLAQLEQLTASFRVSTGSGLSRIKGLGWAEG